VAAHRALADRAPPPELARAGLRGRRVDDHEVHRGVVAARSPQHRAPQPSGGEGPDHDRGSPATSVVLPAPGRPATTTTSRDPGSSSMPAESPPSLGGA
jgi:hypothetical protein